MSLPASCYLAHILRKLYEHYGSWAALERRLTEAHPEGPHLNRHKLKALADNDLNQVISPAEMLAIDSLAAVVNESLFRKPMFSTQADLFECLATRMSRVVSLVSARHVLKDETPRRNMLSDYDVLAMLEFYTRLSQSGPRARIDFCDILLRNTVKKGIEVVRSNFELLTEPEIALVSIGSSRANHFTEELLCRMCGVPRYKPQALNALPFHFVFAQRDQPMLPSAFHLEEAELADFHPKAAKSVSEGSRAMVATVAGTKHQPWLAEPRDWKRSRDLGVVAYQLRPDGQIWIVFAGLSGAGTLAAVKTAASTVLPVPPQARPGAAPPVVYLLIEAKLQEDPEQDGSAIRHVIDFRVLGQGVQYWVPPDHDTWLKAQDGLGPVKAASGRRSTRRSTRRGKAA